MTESRPSEVNIEKAPPGWSSRSDADPRAALEAVRGEVAKAVIGNERAVTLVLIALLCRGHVLLEGVPGVAKTLLVRAVADALAVDHARLQFTPDLMPGDVTGSQIYDPSKTDFLFREGPVFTNLLLADEINRTPAKTQAALLEAMEERQVSVDGTPRPLPEPFMVIATQNPVEQEGTYSLPEAQLDRFLFKIDMALPNRDEEFTILRRHAAGFNPRDLHAAGVRVVAGPTELTAARESVASTTYAPEVLAYVVDLCRATRMAPPVLFGASTRGATMLMFAARAHAWLLGRSFVTPDDVQAVAIPALRHRLILRPEAEVDGLLSDVVLTGILRTVPAPV
ncbi:MoxR family ATPase [Williamsia sp. CHRR-6]|uniref:AAA family ATPase n=1 Tax=Williamsia sp. CHRR-6 TaxID=2835871 RepID=UPI001BDA14EE|nr:MoxR family ATPase [Williamsia sp. CHRR-6]MBT0565734.1 MoxR family ATPase [Williamsia sp. CHRR-6]